MTSIVHSGWLNVIKSSTSSIPFFRPVTIKRRWFILRTGTFPNQFILEYFTDISCRRQKGQINLDECEQIAAPLGVVGMTGTAQDRHKHTFNLRTPNRVYYLASETEEDMNKWVTCLCHVCGLKTIDDETETPVSDANSQPSNDVDTENNESDESSPSLSTHLSGPYIPISECFTGKPIPYNNDTNEAYCNTSFPFPPPPKVNWDTYPSKKKENTFRAQPVMLMSYNTEGRLLLNQGIAPPRPPKKSSPSVVTTTTGAIPNNSSSPHEIAKTLSLPSSTRSVFPYDNSEENHDSSSTCSSLHSPPGSAGALYSNIPEISPVYQNPPVMLSGGNSMSHHHHSQLNPLPSPCDPNAPSTPMSDTTSNNAPSPPKVDRHLKPDLRKPIESPSYKFNNVIHHHHQQSSPSPTTHKYGGSKHFSGAMTLPSSKSQRKVLSNNNNSTGPISNSSSRIKVHESPITLGPTPVQMKTQAGSKFNIPSSRYTSSTKGTLSNSTTSTSTLPSSHGKNMLSMQNKINTDPVYSGPPIHGKWVGPTISPRDKKPQVFHEYEPAPELTYLQIDCKTTEGEFKSGGGSSSNSKVSGHHKMKSPAGGSHNNDDTGAVEYRLIDHVKTQALNQMLQDREEQLRTNHVSKNLK